MGLGKKREGRSRKKGKEKQRPVVGNRNRKWLILQVIFW